MKENEVGSLSGALMLTLVLIAWIGFPAMLIYGIVYSQTPLIVIPIVCFIPLVIISGGFFSLQPKEARVLVLFGKYKGTVKKDGFYWANPFAVKRTGSLITIEPQTGKGALTPKKNKYVVSLRLRNFETVTSKVNDLRGNPIEIGAVVVWYVEDTAKALFEVDDYEDYVKLQSESAVRHLANSYPYDHSEDSDNGEVTLRDNSTIVCQALEKELGERLAKAGVVVEEARITHLAYAAEIAGAMLKRQQAEAIIAARQKIVHGAVSMVEMALKELSDKKIVDLDEERKATMVGNLLVILCGESEAKPVINTGSIY